MNGRVLAALIAAPAACGAIFPAWMHWGLQRSSSQSEVSSFVLFVPGMMYGALFEVIALLPLLLLARRLRWPIMRTLVVGGVILWAVAILVNSWATSEVALWDLTPTDVATIHFPLMLPGAALVLVFAYLA